jgi:probable HAF family extracellular repeat protein
MKIRLLLALIGLAISFASPTFAQQTSGAAKPTYTLTDVGTLNGYFGSEGAAINDRGDVVGTDQGNTMRAFLYKQGKLIDLGITLAPDGFSVANSINLEGQIVGNFSPSGNPFPTASMGFLYASGQVQTLIGPKGEPTNPTSINIFGQVLGDLFFPPPRAPAEPTTYSCANPRGESLTWAPSGARKTPSSTIQAYLSVPLATPLTT